MSGYGSRAKGSIALVVVVLVLLVGALGFVGWRMLEKQNDSQSASTSTQASAEVIMNDDDLNNAEKSLNDLDLSDDGAASAEQQANL